MGYVPESQQGILEGIRRYSETTKNDPAPAAALYEAPVVAPVEITSAPAEKFESYVPQSQEGAQSDSLSSTPVKKWQVCMTICAFLCWIFLCGCVCMNAQIPM